MADLFFRVYRTAGSVAGGPKVAEGKFTIGSGPSSVLWPEGGNRSVRVRIYVDGDAFVDWGDNPSADTTGNNGMPMAADSPEYIWALASDKIDAVTRA